MGNNIAHTTESIYNQQWNIKHIVGDWVGIYIGEGVEAFYLAKAHAAEINYIELYNLYDRIVKEHNEALLYGARYKAKKKNWYQRWREKQRVKRLPAFEYNYPADIDKAHDLEQPE